MSESLQKKNLVLVSIYDKQAEYFGNPAVCRSVGEAIRQFADLCSDKQTVVGLHPSDFTLYKVGEFDVDSGSLIPILGLSVLCSGSDFLKDE